MKKIMYGVTDFARMRAENGYFIADGGTSGRLVDSFHGGDVVCCEEI